MSQEEKERGKKGMAWRVRVYSLTPPHRLATYHFDRFIVLRLASHYTVLSSFNTIYTMWTIRTHHPFTSAAFCCQLLYTVCFTMAAVTHCQACWCLKSYTVYFSFRFAIQFSTGHILSLSLSNHLTLPLYIFIIQFSI